MTTRPLALCEVCGKRPAVTSIVIQHLSVLVCAVCQVLARVKTQ